MNQPNLVVINNDLLREITERCHCDYCGKDVPTGTHPHHIFCRGIGGGSRLDIRCNLAALCPTCHRAFHDGQISRHDMILAVARREKRSVESVKNEINLALRRHS